MYFRFCGWRHIFPQWAAWRLVATAAATSLQRDQRTNVPTVSYWLQLAVGRLMWVYYQQISNCCRPVFDLVTDRLTPSVTDRLLIMYGILLPDLFFTAVVYNRSWDFGSENRQVGGGVCEAPRPCYQCELKGLRSIFGEVIKSVARRWRGLVSSNSIFSLHSSTFHSSDARRGIIWTIQNQLKLSISRHSLVIISNRFAYHA